MIRTLAYPVPFHSHLKRLNASIPGAHTRRHTHPDALRKELPRQTYVVEGSQCTAKLRTFYEACGFVASEGAANSADYLMIRIEEQSGGGSLAHMRQERHRLQ